jgi:hypothetical protein
MQKIKVNKVQPVGRDGTAIYDENGSRFSGFQPELKYVRPGDTVGIDVKVKGNYNNITSMKILQRGTAQGAATQAGGNYNGRERESIEAQTAFKGIIELACHLPAEGKLGVAYNKALDWALARLDRRDEPTLAAPIIKPAERNTGNGIDIDWLKEALRTLQNSGMQGWNNIAVIAGLNKITGYNARSVSEAVRPLTRKQADQFIREIQAALEQG